MKKVLNIVIFTAIIATSIFVACSKKNETTKDDTSTSRKSKFYGKFSKTNNSNARTIGNDFNISEWSDEDLLDLAKDAGYIHNQSILNAEQSMNLSTATLKEVREFIAHDCESFFGFTYSDLSFLDDETAIVFEDKTEEQTINTVQDKITNSTTLGFYNDIIALMKGTDQNANIEEEVNSLETGILNSNINKNDKFMLFLSAEIGYASNSLWRSRAVNVNSQFYYLNNEPYYFLNTNNVVTEMNPPIFSQYLIVDLVATGHYYEADESTNRKAAFLRALADGVGASERWANGCHCKPPINTK